MAIARQMPALDGCYEIDAANSSIGFAARYAMVTTVRGTFGAFHADISFDGEVPDRSIVSVRVEAASLSTGQAQRDEHLRSPDFLDVATYPEITFESAGVQVHDGNHYRLSGELTICAATRPFDIDFVLTGSSVDHRGYQLVGFSGAAMISRADFGLTWNAVLETGGVLVGDEIELSFDIALIRTQAVAAQRPPRWRAALRLAR